MNGIIYCLTCVPTGKKYIGQTKSHKVSKNGSLKPYDAKQRFTYHIRDARNNKKMKSPIILAIRQYGEESFTCETLKICPLDERDKWEAHFIEELSTLVPSGYNRYKISHTKDNSPTHEKEEVTQVEIKSVKKAGVNSYARLYISLSGSGKKDRVNFGTYHKNYEVACEEARKYALEICEEENIYDLTKVDERMVGYEVKLRKLESQKIVRISVGCYSKISLRLYIRTSKEEDVVMEIGGHRTSKDDAIKTAKNIVERLKQKKTEVVIPPQFQ